MEIFNAKDFLKDAVKTLFPGPMQFFRGYCPWDCSCPSCLRLDCDTCTAHEVHEPGEEEIATNE